MQATAGCCAVAEALTRVPVHHVFFGGPLRLHEALPPLEEGTALELTRVEYLLSDVRVQREDGTWVDLAGQFFHVEASEKESALLIAKAPEEKLRALSFHIGVPPEPNHANTGQWPPGHALHPMESGLHWSWQGGFVFLAVEGYARPVGGARQAMFYHIATDANLMSVTVEFPQPAKLSEVELNFDVDALWKGLRPLDYGGFTHSSADDELAPRVARNAEKAFRATLSAARAPQAAKSEERAKPKTTPYRFGIRTTFPQPFFPADNPLTEEGVALGARLFFDPILSRNRMISCSHCHQAGAAFAENIPLSHGVDELLGRRNAMPLFNLVWRRDLFWDGRAPSPREQVFHPIRDAKEMDLDPAEAARRLAADASYREQFARAMGDAPTTRTMALALEQFLLVQLSQDAKFDKAQRGEVALTPQEAQGAALFFGEFDPGRGLKGADCFHCHGGALFTNERYANNGLDREFTDGGRGEVSGKDWERGQFKVPSLRNVALTAPYMHDGRFRTLAEVVEHYDTGVQAAANLDPNLAKHGGPLSLTPEEKEALVAFLNTLTDEAFVARAREFEKKYGGAGEMKEKEEKKE